MKYSILLPLALLILFTILYSCEKNDDIILPSNETTLNILDFGADNTGTVDSSPAFLKLLVAMGNNRFIDVYIPAGRYKISQRIVFDQSNLSGYKNNHGLVFRGAGEDVTELVCDNDEGGFYFNAGTNLITATIRDLSFVAIRDGVGTAIEFNTNNQNPGDHHSRMLQVQNVLIRGEKFNQGYFANGILCYNAWYPMIDNVKITSRYGADSEKYKMNCGFLFQDCYSPLITNSYFWGNALYGLYYKGDKIAPEDGIIKDTYLVGQDNGIYIDLKDYSKWPEPAFHISNCHVNYLKNGVFLKGIRQAFISNNLFYCHNLAGSRWKKDTNPVSTYESIDINCDYTSDVIISSNQFTEPASPRRIGIDISERSSNILIQGNIFNFDAIGIRNNSQNVSRAFGNIFGGEPSFALGLIPYNDITGTLKIIDF
jgi:polygalacturonase